MGDGLTENGQKTSPGFDTFDPGAIVGDTLALSSETHGFAFVRTMLAPNVALDGDANYTLKFKCATPWRNLPGSSNTETDGTGWLEMDFTPGFGPTDVQIVEIDKAGSTPGDWLVFA